jgi:protein-L-isoaspartate(D-aspartate) O-methyltransferase
VVLADADAGVPEHAPFDRIIVTAGAWDLPPAWIVQLSQKGRLVVPLRMRGLTRSIAFDRDGTDLLSRDYCLAAFVPVQGDGAYDERKVMLQDGIAMQTDDQSVELDAAALSKALETPRTESWPGAAWDMPDELDLFVTLNLPQPTWQPSCEPQASAVRRPLRLGCWTGCATGTPRCTALSRFPRGT